MVKIIYNGHISPCNITVLKCTFKYWKTGEIKELTEDQAKHILKNKYFSLVDREVKKEVKREVEKVKLDEKVEFDFDGDGDFDKDDVSMAARAMAKHRKKKRKDKEEKMNKENGGDEQ